MRRAALLGFLSVALGGCTLYVADDAPGDDDDDVPPPAPPVCGNNRIDPQEECDGADIPTCQSLGYYGGATRCSQCSLDETLCDPCPSNAGCSTLLNTLVHGLASSGDRLGVITGGLSILDGDGDLVTRAGLIVRTAVGVPGGWLVASGADPVVMTSLDLDGAVTASRTVDIARAPAMVLGPDNRVLYAWAEAQAPEPRTIWFALAEPDGNIVRPGSAIFSAPWSQVSATTDGTSFFVAAETTVARITVDGTVTLDSSFPRTGDVPVLVTVTSDGPGGWFFASNSGPDQRYVAQRFDSFGAPLGAPIAVDLDGVQAAVADRADLLLLTLDNSGPRPRLRLYRLAPDGSLGAPRDIGVALTNVSMIRHGRDVAICWITEIAGHIATITP